jgi:GTP-binding protein Era
MDYDAEWPDENHFAGLAAAPLLDDELPPDHRSGYVAVVGRPNVGKSTLMNHLLGQKVAIVSQKPQTTRNQLLGILTLPAAQVIFIDTPGIHQPHHKLGEYLVETAIGAIPDADVIVWLVDASEPPNEADRLVAQALRKNLAQLRPEEVPPVILGLNKVDLLTSAQLPALEQPFLVLYPVTAWLPLSAARGHNRAELLERIIAELPLGPRYFPEDQVTDQQTRFIAAELVREAALRLLHEEVPHALAVQVIDFKQRHETLIYISANIIVERQSQKKSVIGERGKTLKKIGQLARTQIESLVESKVYLELWVKVRPKWRTKENELRWLGYTAHG